MEKNDDGGGRALGGDGDGGGGSRELQVPTVVGYGSGRGRALGGDGGGGGGARDPQSQAATVVAPTREALVEGTGATTEGTTPATQDSTQLSTSATTQVVAPEVGVATELIRAALAGVVCGRWRGGGRGRGRGRGVVKPQGCGRARGCWATPSRRFREWRFKTQIRFHQKHTKSEASDDHPEAPSHKERSEQWRVQNFNDFSSSIHVSLRTSQAPATTIQNLCRTRKQHKTYVAKHKDQTEAEPELQGVTPRKRQKSATIKYKRLYGTYRAYQKEL